MERVSLFIDGSNLYHGMKAILGRTDLDFRRFVQWVVGERRLIRTYYYNAPVSARHEPQRAASQQRFFDSLRRIPYFDIRLGRLEPRGDTFVEKGVDIAIAVDMLSMAFHNAYDTAVLVSGDGDFVKALNAVRDLGKHVEVACFHKAYHVKQAADKVIELNEELLRSLWLKQP
ncbi:MAG TPA: NYN domain-containing protein [Phycisphaerae bacterium]|nr:NYN domain-containing protein [Phycisphaerae bacterium]